MNDLCWLLSQLTDAKGNILINGLYDMVAEFSEEEKQLYDKIDFDLVFEHTVYYKIIILFSF